MDDGAPEFSKNPANPEKVVNMGQLARLRPIATRVSLSASSSLQNWAKGPDQ